MIRIVVLALGILVAVWLVFMLIGVIFAALKFLLIVGLIVAVIVGAFTLLGGIRRRT